MVVSSSALVDMQVILLFPERGFILAVLYKTASASYDKPQKRGNEETSDYTQQTQLLSTERPCRWPELDHESACDWL